MPTSALETASALASIIVSPASETGCIGSLAGQSAPAKRRMPLMRLPGARIAIVGASDPVFQAMSSSLAHDLTMVTRYTLVAQLLDAEHPDIVVLDRRIIHDGHGPSTQVRASRSATSSSIGSHAACGARDGRCA